MQPQKCIGLTTGRPKARRLLCRCKKVIDWRRFINQTCILMQMRRKLGPSLNSGNWSKFIRTPKKNECGSRVHLSTTQQIEGQKARLIEKKFFRLTINNITAITRIGIEKLIESDGTNWKRFESIQNCNRCKQEPTQYEDNQLEKLILIVQIRILMRSIRFAKVSKKA